MTRTEGAADSTLRSMTRLDVATYLPRRRGDELFALKGAWQTIGNAAGGCLRDQLRIDRRGIEPGRLRLHGVAAIRFRDVPQRPRLRAKDRA
jgi:hypothetical protein